MALNPVYRMRGGREPEFSVVALAVAQGVKEGTLGGDRADLVIGRDGRIWKHKAGESPEYRMTMRRNTPSFTKSTGRPKKVIPPPGSEASKEQWREYRNRLRLYRNSRQAHQLQVTRWKRRLDYRRFDSARAMSKSFRVQESTVWRWLKSAELLTTAQAWWASRRLEHMAVRCRQAVRLTRAANRPLVYYWLSLEGGVAESAIRRAYGSIPLLVAAVDGEDATRDTLSERYRIGAAMDRR